MGITVAAPPLPFGSEPGSTAISPCPHRTALHALPAPAAPEPRNPENHREPRQRRTAFAILALALGGFAIGTTEFVTMGLLPQIADGTGVDIATAGHYVSAYALGVVIGAPLIAVMAAKVPRKGLLMALMGFFAVAHIAIAFADTYPTVMAARFLAGIPHGAFFGIGSVVAASLVSHQRRTAAVATLLGGLGVANVIGVPARDAARPALLVAPALPRSSASSPS